MEIDFEKQLKQYGFTKQGQQLDNVIMETFVMDIVTATVDCNTETHYTILPEKTHHVAKGDSISET